MNELADFKDLLQEGAITLAKNLLNEGEKEMTVKFDDTDFTSPRATAIQNSNAMGKMSFEDFAAHIALHPPGGISIIDQQAKGRRGLRIGSVASPSKIKTSTKASPNPRRKLEKSRSMTPVTLDHKFTKTSNTPSSTPASGSNSDNDDDDDDDLESESKIECPEIKTIKYCDDDDDEIELLEDDNILDTPEPTANALIHQKHLIEAGNSKDRIPRVYRSLSSVHNKAKE